MRVAEQVSVEQPPELVIELLGQRPATWLQPFLLLAWNEGEAALRRVGRGVVPAAVAPAAAPAVPALVAAGAPPLALAGAGRQIEPGPQVKSDHQLRLSDPACRPGGCTVFGLVWTVDAPRVLFSRLRGDLLVEPFGDGAVLGLRATCEPEGEPGSLGTAQRPVELVVRSLLGHIRTALE